MSTHLLVICALWLASLSVLTAMVGQVLYACICSGGSSSNSSSSRAYVQLGEELVQSGFPQQLPELLRQSHHLIAAAKQPVLSMPLCKVASLIQTAVSVLTHNHCTFNSGQYGIGGAWAAELLQQMLSCAVAAGLMRHLSGGSVDGAAATAACATADSSSSSSRSGAASDIWARAMCSSIRYTASGLFCPTAPIWGSKTAANAAKRYDSFAAHPAVAEVALQQLASWCVVMHRMQVQHQGQRQQLLQQLGKRMRGDLLLLSDPQQRLAELLPGAAFLAAELAQEADILAHCKAFAVSCTGTPPSEVLMRWICNAVGVLLRHVTSRSSSSSSSSLLAVSAAALQLTAELLLRTTIEWQRQHARLTAEQRAALVVQRPTEDGVRAATAARARMLYGDSHPHKLSQLLQAQFSQLWSSGQWQPQLQLLQQGGGQVLLQSLTLAMHCGTLDTQLRRAGAMTAADLLLVLEPPLPEEADAAAVKLQTSRKELFVSQLARKHPVAFSQFLDRCARTGQLTGNSTYILADLAEVGSAKVGTKRLADLLSSPAAAAALGSALCSIAKLQLQEVKWNAGSSQKLQKLCLKQCERLITKLQQLSQLLLEVAQKAAATDTASSSSIPAHVSNEESQQVTASSRFLTVLLSRILVAVDDAAAGAVATAVALDAANQGRSDIYLPSCHYAQIALKVFCLLHEASMPQHVLHMLQAPGYAQSSRFGDAATNTACGTGGSCSSSSGGASTTSTSSSSSSSSSSQPVRWQYLLQLRGSHKLAAAMERVGSTWRTDAAHLTEIISHCLSIYSESQANCINLAELQQLYQAALGYCRTLVAVAPLPVLCNNPGCVELGGVSEAAAARYTCAGCGCRYCSAACQVAGWRSHKKACRRMAACGMRVDGKQ